MVKQSNNMDEALMLSILKDIMIINKRITKLLIIMEAREAKNGQDR